MANCRKETMSNSYDKFMGNLAIRSLIFNDRVSLTECKILIFFFFF